MGLLGQKTGYKQNMSVFLRKRYQTRTDMKRLLNTGAESIRGDSRDSEGLCCPPPPTALPAKLRAAETPSQDIRSLDLRPDLVSGYKLTLRVKAFAVISHLYLSVNEFWTFPWWWRLF